MKPCTNTHSSPVRLTVPVSDQRPITQASAPSGDDLERQRVCEDITRMAYTLIGRAGRCDDATRARIQRRLASLVTDTTPEVGA